MMVIFKNKHVENKTYNVTSKTEYAIHVRKKTLKTAHFHHTKDKIDFGSDILDLDLGNHISHDKRNKYRYKLCKSKQMLKKYKYSIII